ncbi:hypothetical protein AlacWU_04241 [Aspergillus niger]|nr:hypothetical protein AlacWU_04241 [Aspergillus niger]
MVPEQKNVIVGPLSCPSVPLEVTESRLLLRSKPFFALRLGGGHGLHIDWRLGHGDSGRKSVAPEFEAFEMLGNRVLLVCKTAPTRDPVIEIGGEFKEEGQHQGMKAWLTLVIRPIHCDPLRVSKAAYAQLPPRILRQQMTGPVLAPLPTLFCKEDDYSVHTNAPQWMPYCVKRREISGPRFKLITREL